MKKYFFQSLLIASAISAMLISGCSGKTIDDMDSAEQETTEAENADVIQSESPMETTVATTEETTFPVLTSGMTCTTRESDPSVIDGILSKMTLDEKIYQMFIITPESLTGYDGCVTQAGPLTKASIENTPVGGIICFSQNIESWQQTYDFLHTSQKYAQDSNNDIGMFLAVDEEGGSVARVGNGLRTYNSYDMEYYGDHLEYDTVYNLGNTIGGSLSELGFNVDFAPVADVNISPDNELGSRIFSFDAQVVSDMTANFVKGVESKGVASTLKHFPGLGAGTGNTHNGSVLIERSYDELLSTEFVAFTGGIQAGSDFVMVGHQITTASEDNLPGDLSPTVISWLKDDLGFNGLVITDSQSMAAITENYTPAQAAVASINAGVDIILMPNDFKNAVSGVQSAVSSGEITEERINESVYKILQKKFELGLIDIPIKQTTTTTK